MPETEALEVTKTAGGDAPHAEVEKLRLSVYLTQDLVDVVRDIGRSGGMKDAEVIRYLIALGKAVHEEVGKGNQLATTRDGKTVEARIIGVR